jgi:hypothetical protein
MPLMTGCPKVGGLGLGLDAAKLAIVSNTPMEQRANAANARELKKPEFEGEFVFMEISFC